MSIKINLLTDLAKIPDDVEATGKCAYTAPCVVGMMMSQSERKQLEEADLDSAPIYTLIHDQTVEIPDGQEGELRQLQRLFDRNRTDELRAMVKALKEKYHVKDA